MSPLGPRAGCQGPPGLVLGLETSCDETAASVVENGRIIRSDIVATQMVVHAEFGGVVPEVASRQHLATVIPVVRDALLQAGVDLADLDGIAVTCGPGLVGPLLVGVETAKSLAYALKIPVVGVNHLVGHLSAVFLEGSEAECPPPFPHLALLISGGNTLLARLDAPSQVKILGSTRDDAAGEAFDKVAKLLGLGYPGGVQIDRLAAKGDATAFAFPRPLPRRDDLNFSFSGLKTAVATCLGAGPRPVGDTLANFCASFQAAVVDVLVRKSRAALRQEGVAHLQICGGVASNGGLRTALRRAASEDGFTLYVPPARLCTDNAAMIAAAGAVSLARGQSAGLDLNVDPGLPIQ